MAGKPKQLPSADIARVYVRTGITKRGGLAEALHGVRHKTLPFVLGLESSMTLSRFLSTALRLVFFAAIAVYPIVVRKALVSPPSVGPVMEPSFRDSVVLLFQLISQPAGIDYLLGLLALLFAGGPKLLEKLAQRSDAAQHSPYYNLAAAIRQMPNGAQVDALANDEAIRLTIHALQDEMSQLIGDEALRRVTEVTLLEFCKQDGTFMQVRARTAAHEDVRRPVPSERLVAYYVALEGRSFAEHDFLRRGNPFPATRVSVVGSPPISYRSVLYMPIICSERVNVAENAQGGHVSRVIDSCIGVICVHSSRPYRFWRWGDHTKKTGGFANVAIERSMPYIALLKRLLEPTAPRVQLEDK